MIFIAFITEIILPILQTTFGGVGEMFLLSQVRCLFWICFAFMLSKNKRKIVRVILLYFVTSQFVTMGVFLADYVGVNVHNASIAIEAVIFISLLFWLLFKSYERPECAIDISEIDTSKCYVIFRESGSVKIKDILLSCIGPPANSVCIYAGGYYKFNKRSNTYLHFPTISTNKKFAVELKVDAEEAKVIMQARINLKFSLLRNNCILTARHLWGAAGIKLNIFERYFPPLLLRKIARGNGRS